MLAPASDATDVAVAYRERVKVVRWIDRHRDAALAVGLATALEIEIWFASYAEHRPALALAGLLATLPLAYRCRYPLASFVAVWTGLAVGLKVISPDFDESSAFFSVVVVLSLYSLGAHTRGRRAWIAGLLFIPFLVATFVTDDGDPFHPGDIAFGALIMGGPWLAGVADPAAGARASAGSARGEARARARRSRHRGGAGTDRPRAARRRGACDLGGRACRRAADVALLDDEPEEARSAFDTIERTGAAGAR